MTTSPVSTRADPPPRSTPPAKRLLAGLFLLAWIPRLTLVLVFLQLPLGLDDMYQYDMLGLSIARGNGYRWYQRDYVERLEDYFGRWYHIDLSPPSVPEQGYLTVFRPPGYPTFLAAVYLVAGETNRLAAVRLVQSLLGAALAPLTLLLARRLRLPDRAGCMAAIVVALYPILWMYPIGLGSENLFILLTVLGAILMLRAGDDRKPTSALAAGLMLGMAALTRGALALFLIFAVGWLGRTAGWRQAAVFSLAVAAFLIPWSIRNSLVLGRPAFVENSMGYNLFVGYHPQGNGGFVSSVALIPTRFIGDDERDRWTMQQAIGFVRDDPLRALALLPKRLAYMAAFETRELVYFYSNNVFGPLPTPLLVLAYLVLVIPWLAVAGSAPFGLASAEGPHGRNLVLLLIGATLLGYVPVLAEPRFHLPLVPFLAPFAAAAWLQPSVFLSPRSKEGRLAYRLAVAAFAVLIVLWGSEIVRQAPQLAEILSAGGNRLFLAY